MTPLDKKRLLIATIFVGGFFYLAYNNDNKAPESKPAVAQAETAAQAETKQHDDTVSQPADKSQKADAQKAIEPSKPRSSWVVNKSTSAIDDSTGVTLTSFSKEMIPTRFGRSGYAKLVLRCHENTTSMYITFAGNHMTNLNQYGEVTTRIDSLDARTLRMNHSTDNEALGLWSGGQAIPFIKRLFDHDTLTVRATPFNQSSLITQFPLLGVEEAIKPLREACHW